MIRDSIFYKVLSAIHIVFFTSILSFGLIYLSFGILVIPSLAATFFIGRDYLYKKYDITDSIIKVYFGYFKKSLKLMKFIPVYLIFLINIGGMLVAGKSENMIYSIVCLSFSAFLLTFVLYIAGYYTFIGKEINLVEVLFIMFLKPYLLIPVFIIMILCIFFFSLVFMAVSLIVGGFFLFVLEVIIFIQVLFYKKACDKLGEEEYAFLITGKNKK